VIGIKSREAYLKTTEGDRQGSNVQDSQMVPNEGIKLFIWNRCDVSSVRSTSVISHFFV